MRDDINVGRFNRLVCEECGIVSDDCAIGWEAHLGIDDDGTESIAIFCEECAEELSAGDSAE